MITFYHIFCSSSHNRIFFFLRIAANTNNVASTGGHGDQQVSANKEGTPAPDGGAKPQREGKPRNQRPPASRRPNDKPKETLVNGTTA